MAARWDTAYLREAESDFSIYLLLKDRDDVAVCHKLQHLQMATEKLAKAFLSSRSRGRRQPDVHDVLVVFVKTSAKYAPVARAFRMASLSAFSDFIRESVMPVAAELQGLYPKGAENRPNVEYPWEVGGQVLSPADYGFANLNPDSDRVKKFVWYLKTCFVTTDVW